MPVIDLSHNQRLRREEAVSCPMGITSTATQFRIEANGLTRGAQSFDPHSCVNQSGNSLWLGRVVLQHAKPSMQIEAADREVLAGLVERVTFQNADNGFCVLRAKAAVIAT
jgi:hypothetical protein